MARSLGALFERHTAGRRAKDPDDGDPDGHRRPDEERDQGNAAVGEQIADQQMRSAYSRRPCAASQRGLSGMPERSDTAAAPTLPSSTTHRQPSKPTGEMSTTMLQTVRDEGTRSSRAAIRAAADALTR